MRAQGFRSAWRRSVAGFREALGTTFEQIISPASFRAELGQRGVSGARGEEKPFAGGIQVAGMGLMSDFRHACPISRPTRADLFAESEIRLRLEVVWLDVYGGSVLAGASGRRTPKNRSSIYRSGCQVSGARVFA